MEPSKMDPLSDRVNPVEKKIIALALLVSAAHLGLIAYAAIRLGIAVPSCVVNVKPFDQPSLTKIADKRYEAHIISKMWGFEPSKIVVPVGSILDIYLTSKDVTHGFQIGRTNVNLMAIPGVVNTAQVKFDHPGSYPVLCHEYCGAGHQNMNALIEVTNTASDAEADGVSLKVLASADSAATDAAKAKATQEAIHPGRKIIETHGCLACHSLDGKPGVGPTFKGIWGRKEEFTDGTTLVVDAPYIKESILDPPKKVVKGFSPVMPKIPVTDAEIDQIIDYMKTIN